MAIIDQPLRVPILDGAVLFTMPLQNEWALEAKRAEEVQAGDKTTEQAVDEFLARVVGIENFSWADGRPFTADDLRARRCPHEFLLALFPAYRAAADRMFRNEADLAKNGSTPA